MHHPTDRITQTTAFVTPVVEHWLEREIALWDGAYKEPLLLIEKSSPCSGGSGSRFGYIRCPLTYVRRHTTVSKMC